MAAGRPLSAKPTRMIRVPEDIADMLGWITELQGGTVAELLDPIARPEVERLYAPIAKRVAAIKSQRDKAKKELDDVFSNDFEGHTGGGPIA